MNSRQVDLGVAVVAYRAQDIITGCLTSLFASEGARVRVVVVDNASPDGTLETVREWAARHPALTFAEAPVGEMARAEADLTLLRSPVNGGFAYATNRALEVLRTDPDLNLFWLLNPDCEVLPDTAAQFLDASREGEFGLMGGRVVYIARPDLVQTDGGQVSRATGLCISVNLNQPVATAQMPTADEVDFITGASCIASRKFIDAVGLMEEDYFIYYEEVDWAFRRGDLPLKQVPAAVVHHHGGTTTGTGSFNRRAQPFSNYFNYRNRVRFLWRFAPTAIPGAFAYGIAKSVQLTLLGGFDEATALLAGLFGLAPPRAVRKAIDPAAWPLAFGRAAP